MEAVTGELVVSSLEKAATCSHPSSTKTLEQELDDDRTQDIIVERCAVCNFPLSRRYATAEETERFYHGRSIN